MTGITLTGTGITVPPGVSAHDAIHIQRANTGRRLILAALGWPGNRPGYWDAAHLAEFCRQRGLPATSNDASVWLAMLACAGQAAVEKRYGGAPLYRLALPRSRGPASLAGR
jgi:hypothetical protein